MVYIFYSSYLGCIVYISIMKKVLYILGSFIFALGIFAILNFGNKALAACGGDDKGNFNNAGEINCGNEEYKYDPVSSQALGHPVFVEDRRNEFDPADRTYLVICSATSGKIRTFGSGGASCGPGGDDIGFENYDNASRDFNCNNTSANGCSGSVNFCSIEKPTDCIPWNGNGYDDYGWPGLGRGGPKCSFPGISEQKPCRFTGAAPPGLAELRDELETAAANETDSCEDTADNPLSFILCPLERAMVGAVDGLTGFLLEQLKIEPITDYGTGGVNPIQRGFNSFRNIANSLYILIFLVIILSNFISVGLDNYSIKKMLPRLLFAVIATQFAFLICSLMIDLSNVLIVGLPGAVGTIPGAPDTLSGSISVSFADVLDNGGIGGALQGIGLVIFILLLGVLLLVIVAIALAYLIFRNVFLIVLVFLSPLAIAAWVLPQTQSFAKKWANWFIKLIIMGPIIALILAITLLIAGIFQAPGNSEFIQFIAIIVPFIGFAIIPKSLKWSGDVMQAAKGAVAGSFVGKGASAVGNKAKSGVKKSAQEGKLAEMRGGFQERKGRAYGNIPGLRKRGAKLEARGAGLKDKSQEQINKDVGALDFEDQIRLSSSKNRQVKEAARKALGKKQSELLNQRVLTGSDVSKLAQLKQAGMLSDPSGHLNQQFLGSMGLSEEGDKLTDAQLKPLNINRESIPSNVQNPFWNGSGSGSTGTPSSSSSSLTPPAPPPGTTGTSPASGRTTSSPTSSPTSSSSSPSSRWRAATPRPNPAGTSGPRVIPGTGGAVDLSDLGGGSTPPEPPPGTTE